MQTEERFRELLDRYIAGTCTPQEKAIMEQWFEKGGDTRKADLHLSAADETRLLHNIHRLQGEGTVRRKLHPGWRSAAIWLGVLVTAGIGIWKAGVIKEAFIPHQVAVVFREVITRQGEMKQVTLPDHSTVMLNANTTLRYHPDFATHRQLQLSGEALFTVTQDAQHPFTVQTTDSLTTTVLGTRFNINSYAQGEDINITVVSGKVQVSKVYSTLDTLSGGQAIRYNKTAGSFTVHQNTSLAGWVKGEWDYENVRFNDLAVLLQNQYGITLSTRLDKTKMQTHVSVNFNKRQSAREIMEVFCSIAGYRFRVISPVEMEIYSSL